MQTPQRVSAFVASQVSRRDFLRRTSAMALGVAVALPALGRTGRDGQSGVPAEGFLDVTTLQRIRSDTPRALSASEVVALGLPLYLPENQLPTGPDCPCDCSWGCHWVNAGTCIAGCGTCVPCGTHPFNCGDRNNYQWQQCLDCCNDVCAEQCINPSCSLCCYDPCGV